MIIEPFAVDYKKTKCIGKYGDKDVLGYWIQYKWNELHGYAYLFPYSRIQEIKINHRISVETSQGLITDFKKIENAEGLKPFFKPLDSPGDYYIRGEVAEVYKDEENGRIECVFINVDEVSIVLDNEDIKDNELENGDIVEFTLIEFELYDEGYY